MAQAETAKQNSPIPNDVDPAGRDAVRSANRLHVGRNGLPSRLMAKRRALLVKVEKLLESLLTEASAVAPATFDEDGIEKTPARGTVTFGERLRLAEVVAAYEVRRSKIEEDETPSEVESILEEFHGAGRTSPGRPGRKARAQESNGIANAGRTLPPYRPNGAEPGTDSHAGAADE